MNRGFDRSECQAEGLLLLFAGTESTACAIRAILIHAITSPSVYHRLKLEIRTAVKQSQVSSPITLHEAKNLPYLQVVPSCTTL